jgi:hypothetical protein
VTDRARVIDREQLHNELEQLASTAQLLHDETWSGAAAEPYSPDVQAAHKAIEDRLVAAGHAPDVASEAVATWIILGRSRNPEWSVLRSVDFYLEHRYDAGRSRQNPAQPAAANGNPREHLRSDDAGHAAQPHQVRDTAGCREVVVEIGACGASSGPRPDPATGWSRFGGYSMINFFGVM